MCSFSRLPTLTLDNILVFLFSICSLPLLTSMPKSPVIHLLSGNVFWHKSRVQSRVLNQEPGLAAGQMPEGSDEWNTVVSHSVVSDSLRPHGQWSLLGSSVHGILQARLLEWVAISFSRVKHCKGIKQEESTSGEATGLIVSLPGCWGQWESTNNPVG